MTRENELQFHPAGMAYAIAAAIQQEPKSIRSLAVICQRYTADIVNGNEQRQLPVGDAYPVEVCHMFACGQ